MAVKSPLVSVILPFFNAPKLNVAIESILSQTLDDFELVLINNNSTDGSELTTKKYLMDSRVKLFNQPDRGVVHAMNMGIEVSRGAFIARMDADDYSYPDRLRFQLQAFKDKKIGVVSGIVEYEGDSENEGFIQYVAWLNSIMSDEEITLNQFIEFPLANPSLMFRRELFDTCGMYEDGNFPEDYEYFLRLKVNGVRMIKVEETVLKWFDSKTRLTRTDSRYSREAFFRIKAKYLSIWLKQNNPFYPRVLVWGAGRVSRRRSDFLTRYGVDITGYIDVKEGPNTLHYKSIPKPQDCFIVTYVANRGARNEIRRFLQSRDFIEGINFILAS